MERRQNLVSRSPALRIRGLLFWKASLARKAAEEKEERTLLNPTTEPSDDMQGTLQGGKNTADQKQSPGNSEEESTSLLPEDATLVEELENISNGGSTLLDLENNEVYESSDSEGSDLELSYSQSENELSTDSSDSFFDSESESSESSSDNVIESEEEELDNNSEIQDHSNFTVLQLQSLAMIAFLLRHNLTGVAVNDLLGLIKVICPGFSELGNMKYVELFKVIDNFSRKVCHYCCICHNVFPLSPDIYACETPECSGLRYKGGLAAQTKPNRLQRQFFVVSDMASQLKYLLEQDGLLEKIFDTKRKAKNSKMSNGSTLSDISDGNYYRHLLDDGQFLANETCISGMFHTGGIPLYKSSHVRLWPIFLAN